MIDDQVVVAGIDVHARDPRGELDAEILLRLVHHEQLRRSLASGNLIDEWDQQLLEMSRVLFEVPCDVCPVPLADDRLRHLQLGDSRLLDPLVEEPLHVLADRPGSLSGEVIRAHHLSGVFRHDRLEEGKETLVAHHGPQHVKDERPSAIDDLLVFALPGPVADEAPGLVDGDGVLRHVRHLPPVIEQQLHPLALLARILARRGIDDGREILREGFGDPVVPLPARGGDEVAPPLVGDLMSEGMVVPVLQTVSRLVQDPGQELAGDQNQTRRGMHEPPHLLDLDDVDLLEAVG